jgi:hypothetical protein
VVDVLEGAPSMMRPKILANYGRQIDVWRSVLDMSNRYTTGGPNSGKLWWSIDGGEVYGPTGQSSCGKVQSDP